MTLKAYRRTLGLKMKKSTRRLKLTLNLNLNHILIFRPILTGWLWQFLSHLLLSKNIEKAIFKMLWLSECDPFSQLFLWVLSHPLSLLQTLLASIWAPSKSNRNPFIFSILFQILSFSFEWIMVLPLSGSSFISLLSVECYQNGWSWMSVM